MSHSQEIVTTEGVKIDRAALLDQIRLALNGSPAWLVGGAVRDELLNRPVFDFDLVVKSEPRAHARAIAKRCDGHAFELSDDFGTWRVIARNREWQVDVATIRGEDIYTDLAARDFTINAMARELTSQQVIDPFNGRNDLTAKTLKMVGEDSLFDDPLRTLRAIRMAVELGLDVEPQTSQTIKDAAAGLKRTAQERIFAELRRIVCSGTPRRGIDLMGELGVGELVLPELNELKGLEQNRYHHADAYEHTLDALDDLLKLEEDPAAVGLAQQTNQIRDLLSEPLSDELTRGQALRFVVLLHDLGKPSAQAVTPEGGVSFSGHDLKGAEMAERILRRWRASQRLVQYSAKIIEHHLDVGYLSHEETLSRRAIWRFLVATEPYSSDLILLTVADRLATRGRNAAQAIKRHLEVAEELLNHSLSQRSDIRPLIPGDELARELGIKPGPELGAILSQLAEDRFAGEIATREEAIERAHSLHQS
jgi:tRNA nucleotidyltransferase/poly(A) polymerase